MKTTITEGLAEIKTIHARINKKREAIYRYFSREAKMRDPMEKDGGSVEFIRRERQAIVDLEERIIAIRTAIQASNLTSRMEVSGCDRSVAEWLAWRREVKGGIENFYGMLEHQIGQARTTATRKGYTITDDEKASDAKEIIVNVNEQQLAKDSEGLTGMLGALDGKLSLLNATTTIDV